MQGRKRGSVIRNGEQFAAEFEVSRETLERFECYEELLRAWQRAVNLVAPRTLDVVWSRHFGDCAQLFAYFPEKARRIVDLGSGAGFPGLVLAILAEENGQHDFVLVEADARKAAFLRDVASKLGLVVEIVSARIEKAETQFMIGKADVVTARALAPLDRLLVLARPYFNP